MSVTVLVPDIVNWAFNHKPQNLYGITESFGKFQGNLYEFLEFLALVEELRKEGCLNIQEKVSTIADWYNLQSLNSELFFANKMIEQGFNISFVSDFDKDWIYKKNRLPRPDFRAVKADQEVLVEVTRISGDETTSEVGNRINTLVRQTPFRVVIYFSDVLSVPVVSNEERGQREALINCFIDEFKKVLPTIPEDSLPTSRSILNCRVEFTKPLHGKRGYYAGCATDCIIVPDEKFKQYITREILDNAKKRKKWRDDQKSKPYLIALDIQQSFCFPPFLLMFLFGGCTSYSDYPAPVYNEPPIVSKAKSLGWQEFLEGVGFDPRSTNSRIQSPGIFITNTDIQENVSGIVAKINQQLIFLPNPFASELINPSNLNKLIPWSNPNNIYERHS